MPWIFRFPFHTFPREIARGDSRKYPHLHVILVFFIYVLSITNLEDYYNIFHIYEHYNFTSPLQTGRDL